MKHAHRYLILSLILVLLLAIATPALASSFRDTQGHWAGANIEALVQAGIVSGYPDGTFKPNNQISRAEFSTMLVKSLKLQMKTPTNPSFADVSSHDWYYSVAETAAAAGLVTGYQGKFWPNTPITREQIITMLIRALGLNTQADAKQNDPLPFRDASGISTWARGYVLVGKELGLVGGYPDGTFRGSSFATRAEASVMMVKFLQTYGTKVQDPPELTKATYDSETAELELTFDEEVQVNKTDVTKIGFQFNNGESVYFLGNGSKLLTNSDSVSKLTVKVVGMKTLRENDVLTLWLKPGAVVDTDGVPNRLCKVPVDFTVLPEEQQKEQTDQSEDPLSPLTGGIGDLLGGIVDTVATPVGAVLDSVLNPVGKVLDNVTDTVTELPLVGGLLNTVGDVAKPVTGIVGDVTGTVIDTVEGLPVVGGVLESVLDPVTKAVKDVPIVGDLLGAGDSHNDDHDQSLVGGLAESLTDVLKGLPLIGGLLNLG